MKNPLAQMLFMSLCCVTLLACQAGAAGDPAQTVQSYLQARTQSDVDKMISLSCSAWEAQARIEAASFKSMKASLDGVTCKAAGASGGSTLVSCTGKIVTSYNGESRDWSVSDHQYKVVQDQGEWRMCGYQ